MDSMNRTCCTWLTGKQEPRQPGFHSWREMHCIYVKLPSEGCCDFFVSLFFLFFFLAYFSVNHLLITYSLERPNAEPVAPQNAENSFGSPQWNDLILMPGNAGQGPVLIWWIKPRRSSASELTDNYSEPLNLRGEGCQGCPSSPFSLCFVCKDFHFMWQGKKHTAGETWNWNLSFRLNGEMKLALIFFIYFHFHAKSHYPEETALNMCSVLLGTLFWNARMNSSRWRMDTDFARRLSESD